MDYALTPAQEEFRREVRALLAEPRVAKAVDDIAHYQPREEPAALDIYRWLGERGWLAANWPVEYGGGGRTVVESAIVTEEMALAGVPDDAHVLSIDIVGLFLLMEGTQAQKRRFLPPLARGESIATVLYTEPHCGSDLAALATRAEPAGEGAWRLSGRKIYNQKSQYGDHALCAARTTDSDVRFHGITLFLVPLRSPGVTVAPVWSMENNRFNEVILDGIRLTEEHVIGPIDGGWELINRMLLLERTGIDFHGKVRHWFDLVLAHAAATGQLTDPVIGHQLADLEARLAAARALAWRQVSNLARNEPDAVASAASKWYATEIAKAVLRLGMELGGLPATLSTWDGEAPRDGALEAAYRTAPTLTLASGTSEIMLYLIATTGLELFS
jgi:alkylation response protein AidB-like acyl-CoA dehydrogenase